MASIFSRIVSGEIPANKVYETEQTLAFLDINPASRGHTLVICKAEYPTLWEVPADLVAAVAQTAQRVAQALRVVLKPDGLTVLQNNGPAAGQVVFHYHVHLIPRWESDQVLRFQKPKEIDTAELVALAATLRSYL